MCIHNRFLMNIPFCTYMHCYHCKKSADMVHLDRHVCHHCFCAFIEQRVKKSFAKQKLPHGTTVKLDGELVKYLFDKINSPFEEGDKEWFTSSF